MNRSLATWHSHYLYIQNSVNLGLKREVERSCPFVRVGLEESELALNKKSGKEASRKQTQDTWRKRNGVQNNPGRGVKDLSGEDGPGECQLHIEACPSFAIQEEKWGEWKSVQSFIALSRDIKHGQVLRVRNKGMGVES